MSTFRRYSSRTDPGAKQGHRSRPRLAVEVLEDRLTPATIVVTTPADVVASGDGKVSLREAITRANTTVERDIITLAAGVYRIGIAGAGEDGNASGDFDITNPLTIRGGGAASTVIDAAYLDRVFDLVGEFKVTLGGMTIRNGFAPKVPGGGIRASEALLTLNQSIVRGNVAFEGGGIYSGVSITLNHSVVTGNEARGPGGADGGGDGGGIEIIVGRLTLRNSTVSGNFANDD